MTPECDCSPVNENVFDPVDSLHNEKRILGKGMWERLISLHQPQPNSSCSSQKQNTSLKLALFVSFEPLKHY